VNIISVAAGLIGLLCFVAAFLLLRKAVHHLLDWRT